MHPLEPLSADEITKAAEVLETIIPGVGELNFMLGGPLGMKRAAALAACTVASQRFHSSINRSVRHSRYCRRTSSRGLFVRGRARPVAVLKFCWQCTQKQSPPCGAQRLAKTPSIR